LNEELSYVANSKEAILVGDSRDPLVVIWGTLVRKNKQIIQRHTAPKMRHPTGGLNVVFVSAEANHSEKRERQYNSSI